jgi:transposase
MLSKNFELEEEDKIYLLNLLKKSKEEQRAIVLLLIDNGVKNVNIAKILNISQNTVSNIKNRYLNGGKNSALYDKPRSGQPKKYNVEKETEIIALTCTNPPKGQKNWTIRLMAKTLREKKGFETITHETVRLVLKKAQQNLG